jgi:hypothetical protein
MQDPRMVGRRRIESAREVLVSRRSSLPAAQRKTCLSNEYRLMSILVYKGWDARLVLD